MISWMAKRNTADGVKKKGGDGSIKESRAIEEIRRSGKVRATEWLGQARQDKVLLFC